MNPSNISNRALRVKKDKTQDNKTTVRPLRKYNENHDDLRIKTNKSKDVKPNLDVLTLTKVEDHSKNHCEDIKNSDDRENKKAIKVESAGAAKKEISSDKAKSSIAKIDCELATKNCQDENSEISRELDKKMNTFSPNLDASRKTPREKKTLEVRIRTASDKMILQCVLCGKIFNKQIGLCRHLKSAHKGASHACEKCDKIFGKRRTLEAHMDVAHSSQV